MSDIASPSHPTVINWIEIAALGVIWGASFLSVRVALDGFAPLWIATLRILIAALVLAIFARARGLRMPPLKNRQVWIHILGFAVFSNALPFTMIAWAQQHVLSSFVGISMALVPLFTLVIAHVFLPGERLTLPRVAGFALGLIGVGVLIGPGAFASLGTSLEPVARFVCIGVTLSYSIGAVITRRCPPVDPVVFSTASVVVAGAIMLPVTLAVIGLPQAMPGLRATVAMAYLGLMPTAAATLLMVHVIRTAGPTFLTQTNYQVPVWSVIFGMLILSEPLPGRFLAALALILAGLTVSRLALRQRA
ncbi:MAG: EamA family transporter [Rhodobacter sp.]|nr:EamA family transporter [Paracoccaceae bacterium]MCC0076022.1 EamA family transporter [Rhodobacter sp.]